MRVAYNPRNGRVYRVLGDGEDYKPKITVAFVDVPDGNDDLIAEIRANPEHFSYDGTDFFDDGAPRPVNRKAETAKSQLNAADLDAAKKAIEAASTVADLKSTLAEVVELVARLAEALGLEPKAPSVEAMP